MDRHHVQAPEGDLHASKHFDGFNGLGFAANGRLYVGVDVGLTDMNDHGPATTSAHLYQILSFTPDAKHHRIVARGIRQPWQFAFPAHSNSPYVTDLGQDTGATNPPDFILRVKAGQNYGFPRCNHTTGKPCRATRGHSGPSAPTPFSWYEPWRSNRSIRENSRSQRRR